jgi:hypothetical protein
MTIRPSLQVLYIKSTLDVDRQRMKGKDKGEPFLTAHMLKECPELMKGDKARFG